jgi:hypothetical protein
MANTSPITLSQLFRYWRALPHQSAAVVELDADLAANGPAVAMRRDRPWFATWSQDGKQPEPPPFPPANPPAADPQRAGLVGPKKRPDLKPGDHHLVMDDRAETIAAFDHRGQQVWKVAALARGQSTETDWRSRSSDTPPGLYRVGAIYRDYEADPTTTFSIDRRSYGWFSFDLEGMEGQEGPGSRDGRDGIMIHGGGTACGWPGAWLPLQPLYPTLGCIRMHNKDLRDRVLPLTQMGAVYVSVWQEAGR